MPPLSFIFYLLPVPEMGVQKEKSTVLRFNIHEPPVVLTQRAQIGPGLDSWCPMTLMVMRHGPLAPLRSSGSATGRSSGESTRASACTARPRFISEASLSVVSQHGGGEEWESRWPLSLSAIVSSMRLTRTKSKSRIRVGGPRLVRGGPARMSLGGNLVLARCFSFSQVLRLCAGKKRS